MVDLDLAYFLFRNYRLGQSDRFLQRKFLIYSWKVVLELLVDFSAEAHPSDFLNAPTPLTLGNDLCSLYRLVAQRDFRGGLALAE